MLYFIVYYLKRYYKVETVQLFRSIQFCLSNKIFMSLLKNLHFNVPRVENVNLLLIRLLIL